MLFHLGLKILFPDNASRWRILSLKLQPKNLLLGKEKLNTAFLPLETQESSEWWMGSGKILSSQEPADIVLKLLVVINYIYIYSSI